MLTHLASDISVFLGAIRHWIWPAVAHTSPAHVVEGVGVAWFIFVLALLLRTRSDRAEPLDRESPVRVSPADENDSTPASDVSPRRSSVYPPVPRIPTPPGLPALHRSLLDPPYAAADNLGSDIAPVSRVNGNQQGHLLALTGIATSERRPMPYGLFLVAEDVADSSSSGEASRRTVDVIATQIAPLLAHDAALERESVAALFEMAVLRASIMLLHHRMRQASDLGAVVAGMFVVGNDVYVVKVGHCPAYLFRPSTGLLEITRDQGVISCPVRTGLVPPAALYQHPRHDQIYRSVGGTQAATEVDTFALGVQRDDQLVVCSSNLWQSLSTSEIEAIVRIDTDPHSTAERLSSATSRHSGRPAGVIVVRPLEEWTPSFGMSAA